MAELTPLQRLLARANYEDQCAKAAAKARDTREVLAGKQTAPTRQGPKAPASQVVVHLTLNEWQWLRTAAEGCGRPVPDRIASYLQWRTTDCLKS